MATTARDFEGSDPDLGRLTDKEREVLRLLAQGHTAKSIATLVDATPNAIYERLREARRKTGIGSSRELARLLQSLENRHELIGMARRRMPDDGSQAMVAATSRPQMGVFVMIASFLAIAAAAATLMSQDAGKSGAVDPLLGGSVQPMVDPAALHAKVRTEPRNALWATSMEKALAERSLKLPLVGKDGNVLRVTCGSSLCEVAGTLKNNGPIPRKYDPDLPISRAIEALQAKPYQDDIEKLGLKRDSGMFTGVQGRTDTTAFLLYFSRKPS